jgi:hypothetical protein
MMEMQVLRRVSYPNDRAVDATIATVIDKSEWIAGIGVTIACLYSRVVRAGRCSLIGDRNALICTRGDCQ